MNTHLHLVEYGELCLFAVLMLCALTGLSVHSDLYSTVLPWRNLSDDCSEISYRQIPTNSSVCHVHTTV